MKTNHTQSLLILSLSLTLVACSKTETSDMMFKKAVYEQGLDSPVPGTPNSMPAPTVVEENNGAPTPVVTAPPVVLPPPVAANAPENLAPDVIYDENEIPVCKLSIEYNGMGSAARMAIASASKYDLMNVKMDGFENLSASELAEMRKAVETMSSVGDVQVLKNGQSFKKNGLSKCDKVLIVTDGKAAVDVKLNGIGKGAQIYVMNVADQHNTVCIRANGVTKSSKFFETVKGDPAYVSRASIDINGSGSASTFLKVAGGNQSSIKVKANGISHSDLIVRLDGKNDSFVAVDANGISDSNLDFKIKGMDDTGLGIKANGVSGNKINFELEGRDNVKIMMDVNGMSHNVVSGWIKAKSGAKADPSISDSIEILPLP